MTTSTGLPSCLLCCPTSLRDKSHLSVRSGRGRHTWGDEFTIDFLRLLDFWTSLQTRKHIIRRINDMIRIWYDTLFFLSAFMRLKNHQSHPNNLWPKLPVHDVDGNICEGEDDSGDPVDFWNGVERLLRCAHCSGYTPEKYNCSG